MGSAAVTMTMAINGGGLKNEIIIIMGRLNFMGMC